MLKKYYKTYAEKYKRISIDRELILEIKNILKDKKFLDEIEDKNLIKYCLKEYIRLIKQK